MSRIEALRAELAGGRHTVNFFSTADELTRKVNEAVIAWEKRNNLVVDREPADWLAYREAVLDRHQWVRLPWCRLVMGRTPASRSSAGLGPHPR